MLGSGPVSAQVQVEEAAGEQAVIVTPIPMPAQVTELSASAMRPAKKAKVATKSVAVQAKSMLSRTERRQVALLTNKTSGETRVLHDLSDNDDDAPGLDDLDMHRSFARPRVAKLVDQDRDDEAQGFTPAQTDLEIVLLNNLLVLTPGTLGVDLSPDRKTLYIHFLDIPDADAERQRITQGLERRLLEVLR